jgi:UPF0176 protein
MFKIVALYKFALIEDPVKLKEELISLCGQLSISGTLILAEEGINGTVAGSELNANVLIDRFLNDPLFKGMEIKYSFADEQPFYRMRISIKKEIVTMGCSNINPNGEHQGTYVDPEEWNDVISDPEMIIIDTRNNYEFNIGTFKNALNPNTENFGEFPQYVSDNLDPNKHKKIAMFCTGGIRCEKASTYLIQQGFDTVYNLRGGILRYMENVKQQDSRYDGECFVFDNRVSVTHGLRQGTCLFCRGCRAPLPLSQLVGDACPQCLVPLPVDQVLAARERREQLVCGNNNDNSDDVGLSNVTNDETIDVSVASY